MSHNPNTVKSQHELNNQGMRSSEVLLATVAKCERLQKQLDIAIKALDDVATFMTCDEVEIREIQPEFCADQAALDRVNESLAEIKELDNEIHKQE